MCTASSSGSTNAGPHRSYVLDFTSYVPGFCTGLKRDDSVYNMDRLCKMIESL